jgi:hypothetical protein
LNLILKICTLQSAMGRVFITPLKIILILCLARKHINSAHRFWPVLVSNHLFNFWFIYIVFLCLVCWLLSRIKFCVMHIQTSASVLFLLFNCLRYLSQVDHVAIYVGNNIEDSNNSGQQVTWFSDALFLVNEIISLSTVFLHWVESYVTQNGKLEMAFV